MSLITLIKRFVMEEDNTRYRASLYYLWKSKNQIIIHFVITKDQEAHVTFVHKEYTAKSATIGPDLAIEFESECISLDLPCGGEFQSGWRIFPLFHPVITKQEVDSFSPGRRIPSCILTAVWTEQSKPVQLTLNVTLKGAKEPSNFFTIVLDTDSTQPEADFQLEKLLEKYRHQEKIKLKSLKCLFTGPPRTGKTTLKKRLLKIIKNLKSSGMTSPSGGFENPISAVIGETKERNTALLESDIDWQVQHDVLDEAQIVLEFIDQRPTTNVVHPSPYPAQTAPVLPTPYPPPPGSDLPTQVRSWSIVTGYPDSPILDPSHSNQPREAEADTFEDAKQLMQEVLASKGLHSIEEIEKTTTLYLMDTGGQPEFHEIMPLILNGPALHLVFFNLTFDLNKPVLIRFCKQDGTDAMIRYMSSYTGKQMIYQLLSSHYCLSKDLPDSKSAAVLFGTHLDQLKDQKRQGKKKIEEIDGSLKQLVSNAEFHDQGFLTYPKKGEENTIFIPVNNYSGNEKDLQQLQGFLKQVIDDRFDPVELPSSWLFFHLILRHRYENLGVCKLEECRALAKGCGLDEDDVPQVLRYIHRHLGTILFYEEVQGLNELVICDPNVLFKSIYHLVAVSFAGERAYHTSAPEVRKTGEIPISDLQKHIDAQPSSSLLTNDHVVKLLKHFKILTELRDGIFFMPCLLKPEHSLELSREPLQSLCVPPLLIRFDGNYIPVGVFSALVVKLSQTSWEPDPDVRYRNHISFLTNGLSSVELIIYPSYLEFHIPVANHTEKEIHQFCVEVRRAVVNTLKAVLDLHEHTKKIGIQLGFYCQDSFHFGGCIPRRNYADPTNLLCSKSPRCQGQCSLPHKCTIWFDSWKDAKKRSETFRSSCQDDEIPNPVDTTSKTASEEPFGTPSPKRHKTSSGELNRDQPQNIKYENVDNTPLGEDDLSDIIRELTDVVANWRDIGTLLGIRDGQLQTIQLQANSPLGCLREMLVTWLQKNYNVKRFGEPTWLKLVEVVSHSAGGGNPSLAMEIARKHEDQRAGERSNYPTHPPPKGEVNIDQPQSFQHEDVDATSLDEHSLRTIVDSVSTLAAKWFNLGLALGLSYGKLAQIESNHSKDSLRCLTETVNAWLQSSSNPSWKRLVSALRSASLDRVDIATMIAAAHPSH